MADWLASFLRLARQVAPRLADLDVRKSTVLMAAALDNVGFYAALEEAAARLEQDGGRPGATTGPELPVSPSAR